MEYLISELEEWEGMDREWEILFEIEFLEGCRIWE